MRLAVALLALVACSSTPPEPTPAAPSSSSARPRLTLATGASSEDACARAHTSLGALHCEGLQNFDATCRRARGARAVEPDCLAAAKSADEASACTPNFRCVVRPGTPVPAPPIKAARR